MSWRDLITTSETLSVPWTGGRVLFGQGRQFQIVGKLPPQHGLHDFSISGGQNASWVGPSAKDAVTLFPKKMLGYLADGRFIADKAKAVGLDADIITQAEPIWLLEEGLDRFSRIACARHEDGKLIYVGQEFPLGPEDDVRRAFVDQLGSVSQIPYVTPALDLAFRYERYLKVELERIQEENRRIAAEEAERLAREERRRNLAEQLGTGAGRREMAQVDFQAACRAALQVAGATLLDCRNSRTPNEAIVQFRYMGRAFECVCRKDTLRITDAGICLTSHDTGERGDNYFTLESLPGVIAEAIREDKLVVFRHVGGYG